MKPYVYVFCLATILLVSCSKEKRKADLTGIDFNVEVGRFDKDFWQIDTVNIAQGVMILDSLYPEMTDIYLERVVMFGPKDSAQTQLTIGYFLKDTTVAKLYEAALLKFDNVKDLEKDLTMAFRRAHYFFPSLPIPQLYMHLSGFNQSVIVGEDFISLSADNYMGSDFELYKEANIYEYQRVNMHPGKMASDFMSAYLLSEMPYQPVTNNLLEEMIYRGKMVYALSVLFPKEDEGVLMGYTPQQMAWSKANERNMWLTLSENRDLFTTQFIQKGRYLISTLNDVGTTVL